MSPFLSQKTKMTTQQLPCELWGWDFLKFKTLEGVARNSLIENHGSVNWLYETF
jgi:hypothetical protein